MCILFATVGFAYAAFLAVVAFIILWKTPRKGRSMTITVTKQHFDLMAGIIHMARLELIQEGKHAEAAGVLFVAHMMADAFSLRNPSFKRGFFLEACGLSRNKSEESA